MQPELLRVLADQSQARPHLMQQIYELQRGNVSQCPNEWSPQRASFIRVGCKDAAPVTVCSTAVRSVCITTSTTRRHWQRFESGLKTGCKFLVPLLRNQPKMAIACKLVEALVVLIEGPPFRRNLGGLVTRMTR